MELSEGERISFKQSLASVRWIGSLPNKEDTWVGLEWDEESKGKHSGELDGVKYFTTRHPMCGSFMKLPVLLEGLDQTQCISTAIIDKYADRTEQDFSECYVPTVKNQRKNIELVGTEKIQARQEKIDRLKEIALQTSMVKTIDPGFGAHLISCESLLLDKNLLFSWNQIAQILSEIPNLKTLSISQNRINQPLTVSFTHPLKILVLNSMDLVWEEALTLIPHLPCLEELHLYKNRCNVISINPELFSNLKLLNLQDNQISSWEMINQNCSGLPALEKLILNQNQIDYIYYSGGFPRLEALSVEQNCLNNWRSIDELYKFPAGLKELRIQGNPALQGNMRVSLLRFMVVGRIGTLNVLNGSAIRPQERIDAERYYLRSNYDNPEATSTPRWQELVEKHGNPADIATKISSDQDMAKQTLMSTTASVMLRSLVKATAGKELQKKLSMNMTVADLKVLCGKLFGAELSNMKLSYREGNNKEVVAPEPLDDDLRTLNYYILSEGGEIWVEEQE
ncbi:unnamed protein product [Blepharisma stoltei]|uniref:CAP-Gly domain-containing protein n=1 Tax=Blepharisma stoltei TaxID=1481888 RepID=A0AAU9JQZ9_9CILI|nr:unnamed protein product [Blepharisma stoltei]